MSKLIGKVVLRNAYRVLEDSEGNFKVTHKDSRGAEYSQDITAEVVKYVWKHLQGETVVVTDAKTLLEDAQDHLDLPYQFGYKLHFYSQSVLVVLVATKQASYKKIGQGFNYSVIARKTNGKKRPTQRYFDGTRSRTVR